MDSSTPKCIGFIMDGNRRWAKGKNVPSLEGHRQGYEALKRLIPRVHNERIPHMVVYAFSTENWKRAEEEVGYLMKLMEHALSELAQTLVDDGKKINIQVIGEINRLPETLQSALTNVEAKNSETPDLTIWVALSYGGRAEIVSTVNKAVEKGEVVTEATFETMLWTHKMPDPDLIIRTSGEMRLSNFLLWQSAYSELFFTETLWPDFGETEFQRILEEYGKRKRRHGA